MRKLLSLVALVPILTNGAVLTEDTATDRPNPNDFAFRFQPIPFGVVQAFNPLTCNYPALDTATCQNWSSKGYDLNNYVTIDCGECVTLDVTDGSEIAVPGISVVGRLNIPEDAAFTLKTSVILVQGELNYVSPDVEISPVNQKVKIIMTGTDDLNFYPHEDNWESCNWDMVATETHTPTNTEAGKCEIGKKAIIVAGGKIHMDGWKADTCPTWGLLKDVLYDDFPVPEEGEVTEVITVSENCTHTDGGVISQGFEDEVLSPLGIPPEGWYVPAGAELEITNTDGPDDGYYLSVKDRQRDFVGAIYTLPQEVLDCLTLDADYILSVRARYTPAMDQPSNCVTSGTNCLKIGLESMMGNGELEFSKLLEQVPAHGMSISDGEWFTLQGVVNITSDAVDTGSPVYTTLTFTGPEAGVDLSIDSVVLRLPNVDTYPDRNTVCNSIVPNGDAESDEISIYPLQVNFVKGSYITIEKEEDGNQYFQLIGREQEFASLKYEMPMDCVEEHSVYSFKSRLRIHSQTPVKPRAVMKIHFANETEVPPTTLQTIGFCGEISEADGWVDCDVRYQMEEREATARKIDVFWNVDEDTTSDVDFDDIVIERVSGPVKGLVLDEAVGECWGSGSELMVTSHTLKWKHTRTATIETIDMPGDGTAVVMLRNTLPRHTTEKMDGRFASEVALLTRNVLLSADADDVANPMHGGHLAIYHTPGVANVIEGLEVRNFGQRGNGGRYPLHFHMSENVPEGRMARNTIRDSNQRCIVIHNTQNVTVEWNVAYNTFGHCYMLEDGSETGNKVMHNIGAATKNVPPEGMISITESDFRAATFWSASVENEFVGNAAAGSEHSGIWFEMLEHVRGPSELINDYFNPSQQLLGRFDDNRIHSNMGDGLTLYPNGHFPPERARYTNTISFRNMNNGVLFHNSAHLHLVGGTYADNRINVDVDKQADDVIVSNCTIIGHSDLFMETALAWFDAGNHCPTYRPLTGVQLHTFLRHRDSDGYVLENIVFEGFSEDKSECWESGAILMDGEVRDGHYDAYATLRNLTFLDQGRPLREKLSICDVADELEDVLIYDETGDLNPVNVGEPGSFVSNSTIMTQFCPIVHDVDGACGVYCEGSCFRAINFGFSSALEWNDMTLRVTEKNLGLTVDIDNYFDNKTILNEDGSCCQEDRYDNTNYQRRRYVTATLPHGDYKIEFVKDGVVTWPQFIEYQWEAPPSTCTPYITEAEVEIVQPAPPDGFCDDLVLNGDVTDGDNYWLHVGGGMHPEESGYDGAGDWAIVTEDRWGAWQGPAQFLDTRCIAEGTEYEATAKVKLLDAEGAEFVCNPAAKGLLQGNVCPRLTMRMRTLLGNNVGDEVDTMYYYPLAETLAPAPSSDGWNTLHGVFTILPEMANADSILIFVGKASIGVNMIVDNLQIVPKARSCSQLVHNNDAEVGDTRFWYSHGVGEITVTEDVPNDDGSPNRALITMNRGTHWSSMAQDIKVGCLHVGDAYQLSARIQLRTTEGGAYDCNPNDNWGVYQEGDKPCPTIGLRSFIGNVTYHEDVGTVADWQSGKWNTIVGQFAVTDEQAEAERLMLYFTKFPTGVEIIVDDVELVPALDWDCSQLVKNGDVESGDSRYWENWHGGEVGVLSGTGLGGDGASDNALLVSNRNMVGSGAVQVLEGTCVKSNDVNALYEVTARVKLTKDGADFDCDPKTTLPDSRCPMFNVMASNSGITPSQRPVAATKGEWNSGSWNLLTGKFTFLPFEFRADTIMLTLDKAPVGVDLIVDDITVSMVASI